MKRLTGLALAFLLTGCAHSVTPPATNSIHYPSRAWEFGVKGEVTALYDINDAGKAENVRIVSSSPKFMFEDQVKDSIYRWRFASNHPEKDVSVKIRFDKQ